MLQWRINEIIPIILIKHLGKYLVYNEPSTNIGLHYYCFNCYHIAMLIFLLLELRTLEASPNPPLPHCPCLPSSLVRVLLKHLMLSCIFISMATTPLSCLDSCNHLFNEPQSFNHHPTLTYSTQLLNSSFKNSFTVQTISSLPITSRRDLSPL